MTARARPSPASLALALALTALAAAPATANPGDEPLPVLPPAEPVPADTLGVDTPLDDPTGRALNSFYAALTRTARGEGQTRIAVFGASHVAGDSFTRIFRHTLQDRYGDAGIGFIVPAKPWRDYYNRDANLSYSKGWESHWVSRTRSRDDGVYGLAGVSFTSDSKRDWVKVETARRSAFGRTASRVEVFYYKQPKGGSFEIRINGKRKKRVRTGADAAATAYEVLELPDESVEVEIRPLGNGPVTLFGVALDRTVPGVRMDSMGINGARASAMLEWDPIIFADHLRRRDPHLVILAYGTNAIGDTDDPIEDYERRYDLVLARIRSLLPDGSCLVVGPSDRPVKVDEVDDDGEPVTAFLPRPRQAEVIAVQRKLAHRYGCAYWDWVMAMGGDLGMLAWTHADDPLGARDYVHLTRRGYTRIAEIFMDAIMAPYEALVPRAFGQRAPPGATIRSQP